PALKMVVDQQHYQNFHNVGFKDHVTGDISGRGIIKILTFDDAPRNLEVNHPHLTPSFLSELMEAIKSGRIARSDPPRKIVELRYASGTLDISTLSQYHSQTDQSHFPIWSKYFIDDNIKIEHPLLWAAVYSVLCLKLSMGCSNVTYSCKMNW
ncbi:hypothetical protein AAVH_23110, partial [Aphelenchoides avenae]